jgi:hypothetical protein
VLIKRWSCTSLAFIPISSFNFLPFRRRRKRTAKARPLAERNAGSTGGHDTVVTAYSRLAWNRTDAREFPNHETSSMYARLGEVARVAASHARLDLCVD